MRIDGSAASAYNYQRAEIDPPRTEPVKTFIDIKTDSKTPNTPKLEPGFAYPDSPIDIEPMYSIELSNRHPENGSTMPSVPQTAKPAAAPKTSVSGSEEGAPIQPREPCHTCENRKYVDRSDDGGVSYQAPTKISPSVVAAKVMAHEREHVYHERADAKREGADVVHQTVSLKYGSCPDCGNIYVAGGVTRTMTTKEAAISSYGSFKSDSPDAKVSLSV